MTKKKTFHSIFGSARDHCCARPDHLYSVLCTSWLLGSKITYKVPISASFKATGDCWQVSIKMGDGGDVEALMSKMDKLQTELDAIDGWEIDRQLGRAMDALRCPPGVIGLNFALSEQTLELATFPDSSKS